MPSEIFFSLSGHFPELSLFELQAVMQRLGETKPPTVFLPRLLRGELASFDPITLFPMLGGSIKFYRLVDTSPQALEPKTVVDICRTFQFTRINFSTFTDQVWLRHYAAAVKKLAHQENQTLNYRLLTSPTESAGVKLSEPEFLLLPDNHHLLQSIAIQDIAWWSKKDYGRPKSNPQGGMLPPKVARILVNCALTQPPPALVFDPFCGVGTILIEALDSQCHIIGADLDPQLVKFAEQNVDWFNHLNLKSSELSKQFFVADAQRPNQHLLVNSLDAVVFEGFLGPRFPQPKKIDDYIRGLEKMYLGVFKHVHPLLKPGSRIVAAVPAFVDQDSVKTLKRLIDRCEKLGYTPVIPPLWYYRPQAFVRRLILIWQKR